MSLKLIDVIKPIPKKYELKVNEQNIGAYFNYKSYVSIETICENLLTQNDDALYSALSIFSEKHYKNRNILYYNLQDLFVEKTENNKLDAGYTHYLNFLTYFYKEDVYHELLHVASSYLDEKNKIFYSGFNYYDFNTNQNFGEGIMEGYVELLVQRDTRKNRVIEDYDYDKKIWKSTYCYVNALARQLEILIGKEEMEDMFFKNGFIRLKEWLLKYKDENSVMKFFKNCDIAVFALEHNNIILNKKTLEAQEFIFDICKEFMPEKLELLRYEKLVKDKKGFITARIFDEGLELEKSRKVK